MNDIVKQRKLTRRQSALVDTLVAEGGSIKSAAERAGYAAGESGRVSASKTLRLPHVQEYMMLRITETLGLNATIAAARVASC